MEWTKGQIEGVVIKKLVKHVDERGFLVETFRIDELPEGLRPLMSYVSYTEPGITRGPHEHKAQTDIFSFIGPGNFMVKLWDNRRDSKTYGNYMKFFAGEDNPLTVVVPSRSRSRLQKRIKDRQRHGLKLPRQTLYGLEQERRGG
ncbi:dTDP-4-dehydrorhamnose 3,5-epimerase family protein [Acetomicrobium sp.]|uniref:dTDP-4-dehydrorhamnose 3,5-epimerase family protein n=1 Tax=Acetomicrobium sp. TaxID=1872099 RepID=UPI003D998975